jgi:CBS domain-containing protein/heme-degrading monooxygenase HmoA
MKAWLTARRVKKGHEEEFRQRWRGGDLPDGMLDAFLLEDEEDPRETLSVSFWDTADKLLKYRTSENARKRRDQLSDVVDKDRWSRSFVAFSSWDIPTAGGKKKWFLLPLLLAGVGAGVFLLLKRRGSNGDDEWDTWEPAPSGMFHPDQAPVTATADSGSPRMPPPSVRPLEGEARNGGEGEHGRRHRPTGETMGARPAAMQAGAQSSIAATGTLAREAMPPAAGGSTAAGATAASGQTARGGRQQRRVRDVMTPNPETVEQTTDAATAARMMRDLNVGVLPVLADGRLAGIVTDRDLALGVSAKGMEAARVRIGDLMTDMPAMIGPDDSVEHAAHVMGDRQVRRLPVVEGTKLVGIVSLGDLSTEGAQAEAGAALNEISEPARPDR